MADLEETLQRVLSNPEEMEKIMGMAAQLLGGDGQGETASESAPEAAPGPGPMGLLKGLLSPSPSDGNGNGDKTALLNALAPYLREDRRKKLQKAMRLARAARVAGVVLNEFGGEGGGL